MNFAFHIKLYLLTIPLFAALDLLWLGVIAKGFYQKHLAEFLSPNVNWTAAIAFYLTYITGILVFAVVPALNKDSVWLALIFGGLFGFFTYATYDLTNLATLKNWPVLVVIVDILWGAVIGAAVSTGSFFIGKWLV